MANTSPAARERWTTSTLTAPPQAGQEDSGTEFWLARDLQRLLGYARWENFVNVLDKARTACQGSGYDVEDHFLDVTKMVGLGSGAKREIEDVALSRYACYLVAQNGDPAKPPIAFAQTYFAYSVNLRLGSPSLRVLGS